MLLYFFSIKAHQKTRKSRKDTCQNAIRYNKFRKLKKDKKGDIEAVVW
jgi:hypothetical protein